MLDKESFDHLMEYMLLRNIQWKIGGHKRLPTRVELQVALDDLVSIVRESPESISIEVGGLLVKRSDAHIDVYIHVGAMPFNE